MSNIACLDRTSGDEEQFINWVTSQHLKKYINTTVLDYAIFHKRYQIRDFIKRQLLLTHYHYTGEHIISLMPQSLWNKNEKAIQYRLFGANHLNGTAAFNDLLSALEGNERTKSIMLLFPVFTLLFTPYFR